MATPLKPWERNGASRNPPKVASTTPRTHTSAEDSKSPGKPAVPPRPSSVPAAATGSYSNPYSVSRYYSPSYSTGPSYGYGMYGSGYGYHSPYGMYRGTFGGQDDSAVFRQAEERTRMAFQSVESVVGAVASISMMLESTYVAVHSCFRALIGVAEQFSRFKNQLWSIISAISVIQRLRYILRQLLHFLRLRRYSREEETWDGLSVLTTASLSSQAQESSQRLWPVIMFFTVIVGVPWLLWRLVTSISVQEETSTNSWSNNGSPDSNSAARALYNFTAENTNELTINAGDELVVAPRQFQPNVPGWILVGRNKRSGVVPANYIEILPPLVSDSVHSTAGPSANSSSVKNTPSPPCLNMSED